jgi:hypothetical protein
MAADATIGPIDNTTTANIRGQTQRLELAREHATVNFAVASDQGDHEHGADLDGGELVGESMCDLISPKTGRSKSSDSVISQIATRAGSADACAVDQALRRIRCNAPDEIGAIVSSPDPKGLPL